MKNVSNTCGNHEKLLTAAYDMQDRMWGLSISAAGHTASALPCKQVNNAKKAPTEYTLVCIAYGSGYLNNNINNHKPVETGDIILIFPGEEYTLTPGNEGYNIYWVEFGGYAIDNIVRNNFFSDKKNIFQANDLHHIIDTFEEILKTMDSGRNGRQQYAGGLVYMLLGKLYYCAQNDNTDEGYMLRIISLAKSIMKNEAQMHLPMDVIAQELGISYSLFRREFRRICGLPPGQYRQEVKLEKAKELLHTTNTSIADIANQLSFENLGQFSTFFRKRVGIPPLEYRKKRIYSQTALMNNKQEQR